MIEFNYIVREPLNLSDALKDWIAFCIEAEQKEVGEINYIFCDDEYLLEINVSVLKHSTLTDIISLDYSLGHLVSGDIYISVERVRENADKLGELFEDEMHRVMIHGILHFLGHKDKTAEEKEAMRAKEDYCLSLRTF